MTLAGAVDVEAAVVAFLSTKTNLRVSTSVDYARPESFVRVTRTGGVMSSEVDDQARVLIETWAPSSVAAASLALSLRHAMLQLFNTPAAGAYLTHMAEAGGPVSYPDPLTSLPRYRFEHEVLAHAQLLETT